MTPVAQSQRVAAEPRSAELVRFEWDREGGVTISLTEAGRRGRNRDQQQRLVESVAKAMLDHHAAVVRRRDSVRAG